MPTWPSIAARRSGLEPSTSGLSQLAPAQMKASATFKLQAAAALQSAVR